MLISSLKVNITKTELVQFANKKPDPTSHEIAGQEVQVQPRAKCLGTWWQYDLSPTTSVEECIHKAKCAFFALGSIGAFQGKLNPLTGRSLFETFVIPTMLYGCETWILSESHLALLESCQAEIGKRILGLSKYHSNASTLIGLHWPSVTSRILIRQLGFHAKLLKGEEKLSAQVLRTLACEDIYNISLIQQCRTLEHLIGTNHLQSFLQDTGTINLSDIKKDILDKDWKRTLHLAHPTLHLQ